MWLPELTLTKVGGQGPVDFFRIGEWFSYHADIDLPFGINNTLLLGVSSIDPYNDGKFNFIYFIKFYKLFAIDSF